MKYHNIQRIWDDPIYTRLKKHFCPGCGERLHTAKHEAILTPEQAVSRNFHPNAVGKTKYIWEVLGCPGCGQSRTIPEMKRLEKETC